MSNEETRRYSRDEFLEEFFPDDRDKTAIAAGMKQLRAEQRAWRLAEMRRRLGVTQVELAGRMGVSQGRVSAIEHAKPGANELQDPRRLRRSARRPLGDHRRLRRPAARFHRTRHRGSLTSSGD